MCRKIIEIYFIISKSRESHGYLISGSYMSFLSKNLISEGQFIWESKSGWVTHLRSTWGAAAGAGWVRRATGSAAGSTCCSCLQCRRLRPTFHRCCWPACDCPTESSSLRAAAADHRYASSLPKDPFL